MNVKPNDIKNPYREPIKKIHYKIWKFTAILSINNLLGLEYSDEMPLNESISSDDDSDNTNNILLPGTWVRFGLRFPN